ncbi:hypothetical protein NA78x_000627 [Anatilimnocola sp. NA78]|uniref:hypothetical protein n=1 Tax=Anatilimnocola sp. NA78 TaxID=3415683 RepID=UPI003CE5AC91
MPAKLCFLSRRHWLATSLVAALVVLSLVGCSSGVQEIAATPEVELLYKVQSGYELAYNKLGRPPKDFTELQPFLGDNIAAVDLVSPNDGLPYVIRYGTDTRNFAKGTPVVAYEQQGKRGVRRVLTAMTIETMDEATFQKQVPLSSPMP